MHRAIVMASASLLLVAACQDETVPDDTTGAPTTENVVKRAPEEPAHAERVGGRPQIVGTAMDSEHGEFLTDANGHSVYVFTADTKGGGESACYEQCSQAWPPVLTEDAPAAGAEDVKADLLGTVTRTDGLLQVTYDGRPLYYYQQDTGRGETKGQGKRGFGGQWYLVHPDGQPVGQGEQ